MDHATFRAHFITQFLATWVAQNYANACSRDNHKMLEEPPCEDAEHLAEAAWRELDLTNIVRDGSL